MEDIDFQSDGRGSQHSRANLYNSRVLKGKTSEKLGSPTIKISTLNSANTGQPKLSARGLKPALKPMNTKLSNL